MTSFILTGFKFKPAIIKKQNNESKRSVISKKLYCVCMKNENNEYTAHVNIPNDLEFPDTLCVSFTKESYDLKGKTDIFSKKPLFNGKYIRISRPKIHSDIFPNLDEIYTPFKEKYVYGGYLIKHDGHFEFDVTDFVDHYLNVSHLVPNIKLNINNYEKI